MYDIGVQDAHGLHRRARRRAAADLHQRVALSRCPTVANSPQAPAACAAPGGRSFHAIWQTAPAAPPKTKSCRRLLGVAKLTHQPPRPQQRGHPVHMLTLHLDHTVLERAAASTRVAQFPGQNRQCDRLQRQAMHQGHGLAATALAFAADPDFACGFGRWIGVSTLAFTKRMAAGRAHAPTLGGIHQGPAGGSG